MPTAVRRDFAKSVVGHLMPDRKRAATLTAQDYDVMRAGFAGMQTYTQYRASRIMAQPAAPAASTSIDVTTMKRFVAEYFA